MIKLAFLNGIFECQSLSEIWQRLCIESYRMKKLFLVLISAQGLFFIPTDCISVSECIRQNGMPALTHGILDLSNKNLTSLEDLEDTPNLHLVTELYLGNNQLQSLPDFIFNNLAQLKGLDLTNNQLQSLPATIFHSLTQLRWLELNGNRLLTLPATIFDNLAQLQSLSLSHNQLKVLPITLFNNLAQLEWLGISHNQLQSLPATIFDNLDQLRWIHLSNNQLHLLPDHIFDNLAHLRSLYLNNNQLQGTTQQFQEAYLAHRAHIVLDFKSAYQEKSEKLYQECFDKVRHLTINSKKEKVILLHELDAFPSKKNMLKKLLSLLQGLLSKGYEIVLTRDSNGDTLLHKAIFLQNPLLVKKIAQLWPQLLVAKNNQGQTPLRSAMTLKNRFLALAITKVLLAGTYKPKSLLAMRDNNGDTPIQAAISNHQFTVLQFLLTLGYDYKSSKLEHKINKIYNN